MTQIEGLPRMATCHPNKPHLALNMCKSCYQKLKRAATPDQTTMMRRASCHPERYHLAFGMCKPCYDRRKRLANPQQARAKDRHYYAAHLEKERQRARQRIASNPNRHKEQVCRWKKSNPEKVKAQNAIRRARKKSAHINDLTAQQWAATLGRYHYRCFYCGKQSEVLHQEHMIPLSRGGNHTASNIVPACPRCNYRKGTKTSEEFMESVKIMRHPSE